MKMDKLPPECGAGARPTEVLQQFVGVFASRGMLNKTVRIKHRSRSYRISCSDRQFMAYRINDSCSSSHGVPGWGVCIVDHNQIIEDRAMSAFPSSEPSAGDWLLCIANGDFEVIAHASGEHDEG
ncbi:MAG: hypothetical protein HY673_12385 [Chloroflexi bacterium]|nr:hypothetical protein [Chloroflexota bacterium]